MKKIFIALLLSIFITSITPVSALVWHTTEVSVVEKDPTSCLVTDITNANDTNWTTYGYCQAGGVPPDSLEVYENYTYNSDWNRSDTENISVTFKYGTNHSYMATRTYAWNFTDGSWDTVFYNSNNATDPLTFTYLLYPKEDFLSGTNPIMLRHLISNTLYGLNKFYESSFNWQGEPYITNCSGGGTEYITFYGFDEEDQSALVYDLEIDAVFESGNESFIFAGSNNYSLCVDPGDIDYQFSATLKYSTTGYSTRYYYIENATITSEGSSINLYLLNSSDSTLITNRVLDQSESEEPDVIIQAQKYNIGDGTFTLVAEGRTDFSGYTYINLELHEIYKFFLIRDNVVLREYEEMQLETTELTFYISTVDIPEYFDYWDKVVTSCSRNSTTAPVLLTCSYVDTSGLTMNMDFNVDQLTQAGYVNVCNDTSSGASGTFSCTLSSNDTFKHYMRGTYFSDPETYVWQQGFTTLGGAVTFGAVGLILAFLLVSFSAFISYYDIKASLVATAFSIIFSMTSGLIYAGVETLSMMMTVALLFMIVAVKVK